MAARVDAYLTGLTRNYLFSGAALLAWRGKVLLRKGYGMADWARKIPNTSSTTFEGDAIATEFAPVAVLQLVDAGKVHEQDHLCAYLPKCPAPLAPITLHELLNQSSGLHDYINDPATIGVWGQSVSLAQLVALITNGPTDWTPGTRCCGGYPDHLMDKYLVERVTGEPFGTYVRRHFLGPFGLSHTGYYLHYPPRLLPFATGYAIGYIPAPDTLDAFDFSFEHGSTYSTIGDYYRWVEALRTGQVLSAAASARTSTTSYVFCSRQCSGFPFTYIAKAEGGWAVVQAGHRREVLYSGALDPVGASSSELYYPDVQVVLVILENRTVPDQTLLEMEVELTARIFG
jgi:CubicO group peptidase (beta-lactamase class C family)